MRNGVDETQRGTRAVSKCWLLFYFAPAEPPIEFKVSPRATTRIKEQGSTVLVAA